MSQASARQKAAEYLSNLGGFSRSGLISQLEFEGFSEADATYGTDSQNADWNFEAAQKAQSYMQNVGGFSHQSLVDQLEFDGFTPAQAEYGVSTVGL